MVEMSIYGVSFDLVGKQPIVLLKTAEGNRYLPIWIGHSEAAAILMKLQGSTAPRPLTHDLLMNMLGELDVEVVRVTVTELRDNTFHASITIAQNGAEVTQSFEMTPLTGPVGTPIELRVKGLGWRTMENTWVVNWDNRGVGFVTAVSTHGSAIARFRATPASSEISGETAGG